MEYKENYTNYILDHKTKETIKKYCRTKIETINKQFLSEKKIYENELLEYFFTFCKKSFETTGEYSLTQEDISFLVFSKTQIDSITEELGSNNAYLWGVDSEDELIFQFYDEKKLIEYNKGIF